MMKRSFSEILARTKNAGTRPRVTANMDKDAFTPTLIRTVFVATSTSGGTCRRSTNRNHNTEAGGKKFFGISQ